MAEAWTIIPQCENRYQVSTEGRVRNVKTGRILKPSFNSSGYYHVCLYVRGKSLVKRIHRLVAVAFLPNPFGLPEVNHVSGIKTDNSVLNLEWCTRQGNIKHSVEYGLFQNLGEKHSGAKLNAVQVEEIRRRYNNGERVKDLYKEYNVCRSTISHIVTNRRWNKLKPAA